MYYKLLFSLSHGRVLYMSGNPTVSSQDMNLQLPIWISAGVVNSKPRFL